MPDPDSPSPMTDADVTPPPADTSFQPAEPLKTAGVEFGSAAPSPAGTSGDSGGRIAETKQQVAEKTADLREQATDKARLYAEDGKAKATSALGQLSGLLNDAAGQVDDKLGQQYGQYARTAADKVQSFSSAIDSKSVDELFDEARELVRKSPAVAIGAAAAVGFVVARLLTAGVDQRDA